MDYEKFYSAEELAHVLEEEGFWRANLYITPPEDGFESEEDIGDEDSAVALNNLSRRQLDARAVATVTHEGRTFNIGETEHSDSDPECSIPLSILRQQMRKTSQRNWSRDTDLVTAFPAYSSPERDNDIPSEVVPCFELFFDESVVEFLRGMTNLYAGQKGEHNLNVSTNEIRSFIGILLLSGYAGVSRWRMWWEVGTETFNTFVANAMRRNRFEKIKKYIHCADNSNLSQSDKFGKVRPLFEKLNEKFIRYSSLPERLCIDESMVPYFGKHGAKQFLKGKPIRYGYKMWCMCERLGYLVQFEPYQGKMSEKFDLGVGGSVVMNLVKVLPPNMPFKFYGDRFFSSLKLVQNLKEKGYGYTGTIKHNRIESCPIIPEKEMKRKKRGTFDYCTDTNNNCTVTSWNDNRVVLLVSSCDNTNPPVQANRWISKEKRKLPIPQPFVVSQYNKFMGGTDRMDQNIENYRILIRSKKWWWPLFAFCIDVAVSNAWQLYRRNPDIKCDLLEFRRTIAQVYLHKYKTPSAVGRPVTHKELTSRVHDEIRFDRIDHWIVPAIKQNRCAICKKNSTKMCEKCTVNLHENCFKNFHIRK